MKTFITFAVLATSSLSFANQCRLHYYLNSANVGNGYRSFKIIVTRESGQQEVIFDNANRTAEIRDVSDGLRTIEQLKNLGICKQIDVTGRQVTE